MDADAAFARFRVTYEARVDALFDALVGRGMDVAYDRAILRDLLALAPPGIDELYALSMLGETLSDTDARFDRVIVDPAPTGHLLRLLEIPALALQWTHQLMRLMLKYREVAGLGDAAEELLAFSKRTRALDAILHDLNQGVLVITAIDEPLVRSETARLVREVRARGIAVQALVWNRVAAAAAPLPTDPPLSQLVAPDHVPAPVGVPAIRAWSRRWSSLEPRHG
jgi:arsenite-transporting ATPase